MKTVEVPLDKIQVGPSRRKAAPDNVKAVADSIQEIGLQHPIGLTKSFQLIHGRNRLEAYRLLGHTKIPAILHDLDELHAELAEIDENISRNPLSAVEQTKAFARRKEIFETLHPESKPKAKRGKPDADRAESGDSTPSFAADTAQKTGKSRRTVQRDVAIGKAISDEVAALIKDTPVADNKSELKKLAKLEPEEQKLVAQMLAEGEVETVSEAITSHDGVEQEAVEPSEVLRQMLERTLDTWFRELRGKATNLLAAAVLENVAQGLRDS